MRSILVAFAAGLAAAALTACGGSSGRTIAVRAGEVDAQHMYFEPKEVHVQAGEKVTFVIENEGTSDHEFESDEAGIEEVLIPEGRTRRTTWTAPKQPGRYPVYCDIAGHREAGMELTLVVDPAP
ncbi:MAG: cupredoxin domain-containing protein [Chloroflexota bacterium]|nr:cupredoxin domain-containing protein [Dehalococcoidia bacterium]MDW8046985.1 cupredoxin domain-containing protein [Chloroflexota bacterium]